MVQVVSSLGTFQEVDLLFCLFSLQTDHRWPGTHVFVNNLRVFFIISVHPCPNDCNMFSVTHITRPSTYTLRDKPAIRGPPYQALITLIFSLLFLYHILLDFILAIFNESNVTESFPSSRVCFVIFSIFLLCSRSLSLSSHQTLSLSFNINFSEAHRHYERIWK